MRECESARVRECASARVREFVKELEVTVFFKFLNDLVTERLGN